GPSPSFLCHPFVESVMSSSIIIAPPTRQRHLDVVSSLPRPTEAPAATPPAARPAPGWWEALLWTLAYVLFRVIPVAVLGVWLLASGRWDGLGEFPQDHLLPVVLASQILGIGLGVF